MLGSMPSWVRYSVAAYAGLLLAGALLGPPPSPSVGNDRLAGDLLLIEWQGQAPIGGDTIAVTNADRRDSDRRCP